MDITLLLTAITAFIATNLDDLFVLMLFFAHPDYNNAQIVIGQYLGISTLILISSLSYFFKFIIPANFIGLLGIFPIIIGVKKLIDLRNDDLKEDEINEPEESKLDDKKRSKGFISLFINSSIFTVASISFINGGDNIGVYAPLFATFDIYQLLYVIFIFLIMIGIWCYISYRLVNNQRLGGRLRKYGHLILPFVLILIGISILITSI